MRPLVYQSNPRESWSPKSATFALDQGLPIPTPPSITRNQGITFRFTWYSHVRMSNPTRLTETINLLLQPHTKTTCSPENNPTNTPSGMSHCTSYTPMTVDTSPSNTRVEIGTLWVHIIEISTLSSALPTGTKVISIV